VTSTTATALTFGDSNKRTGDQEIRSNDLGIAKILQNSYTPDLLIS
jgi:hypothetical protein